MKTVISPIIVAGLILGSAFAAPAGRQLPTTSRALRTTEEFQKLHAGDSVAMVCTECASVTVRKLESDKEAMDLCKEGETITCPSCNKVFKIVRRQGPRSQATGTRVETRYVNDEGKECMFMVKLEQ